MAGGEVGGIVPTAPTGAVSVVVTTLADTVDDTDNVVSLREAIAAVDAGGTITFDASLAGGTITLAGTQLEITKSLTIDASTLAGRITINANQRSRVIFIDHNIDVVLKSLAVTGGWSWGNGGGILNMGSLTVNQCRIYENTANLSGGGIYSDTVCLTHW